MENAQQEEVFREFLMLLWANGVKMPYGAVNKLVRPYNAYGFKAVTKKKYIIGYHKIKNLLACL